MLPSSCVLRAPQRSISFLWLLVTYFDSRPPPLAEALVVDAADIVTVALVAWVHIVSISA